MKTAVRVWVAVASSALVLGWVATDTKVAATEEPQSISVDPGHVAPTTTPVAWESLFSRAWH